MSAFPDFLFKLTPRDEQVTPLEIVHRRGLLQNDAGGNMPSFYRVDQSKILIIKSVIFQVNTGAATTVNDVSLFSNDAQGNSLAIAQVSQSLAANTTWSASYSTDFFVPPDHDLIGNIDLLGGAAYDFYITINGILIPRGNFAV